MEQTPTREEGGSKGPATTKQRQRWNLAGLGRSMLRPYKTTPTREPCQNGAQRAGGERPPPFEAQAKRSAAATGGVRFRVANSDD